MSTLLATLRPQEVPASAHSILRQQVQLIRIQKIAAVAAQQVCQPVVAATLPERGLNAVQNLLLRVPILDRGAVVERVAGEYRVVSRVTRLDTATDQVVDGDGGGRILSRARVKVLPVSTLAQLGVVVGDQGVDLLVQVATAAAVARIRASRGTSAIGIWQIIGLAH